VREQRDERELVRRCREGSESAYAELVRAHRSRLYLLAYRLTGDRETAEDVVQETFLAAFRSIEKVDPRPSLSPWLNTIVLRTAGRAASRARSRAGASIDQATWGEWPGATAGIAEHISERNPGADPHAAAEAAELRRDLTAALVALPFKYRAAVVLRHVMGLDYTEAARELDVPLNTFKSHLLRGTRLLRESLQDRLTHVEEPTLEMAVPAAEPAFATSNGPRRGEFSVGSGRSR
jgi:RNA polymerase sigma-70 factor, ECF subfamily